MSRSQRLASGIFALVLGTVFVTPPLAALYLSMAVHTVEIRPWWIPELLIAMAVLGALMMICGIWALRHR